ncbi:hypothetical protein NPIL_71761 [Nephila pilipes]|uniref:Uncharacterized protein n=1 Tax=Nephila pilipes TaxID=299642 RepID=A0A8X6R0M3_NEPPI|nr:hypothetical protein NPIL_71761 [Nephila pilipes]
MDPIAHEPGMDGNAGMILLAEQQQKIFVKVTFILKMIRHLVQEIRCLSLIPSSNSRYAMVQKVTFVHQKSSTNGIGDLRVFQDL